MIFERIPLHDALRQTEAVIGSKPNVGNVSHALDSLRLPCRVTEGSAGYDFFSPFDVVAKARDVVKIPLFVRVSGMPKNAVLLIFNRSGLSLKKGLRLDNAVGVVDSDYEDGIVFQATATKDVVIMQGDRVCQGVFVNFLTVDGDSASGKRDGGFGSTGR